jgi:hypothetical protein
MHLELVSHCWRYPRLLNYQLSSLVLHPPSQTKITMTVFLTPSDKPTTQVVQFFAEKVNGRRVCIRGWRLPKYCLLRREIGRNQAALATTADWIWFTDCDHYFGPGALDAAADALRPVTAPLAYPQRTLVNATAAEGDALIERLTRLPQVTPLEPDDFVPYFNDCAIGGIQLARGDAMRQLGYLNGSRYLRPARTWQRTFGDVAFRQQLGTDGVPVEIPHVYRILHTKAGRNDEVAL